MSRWGCLLVVVLASTQVAQAQSNTHRSYHESLVDQAVPTSTATAVGTAAEATPVAIPTVTIPQSSSVSVPTVTIPQPTATATATPIVLTVPPKHHSRHLHKKAQPQKTATPPAQTWILAFLTSYCPGSAGWLSASGMPVFYGMLANDYYPFGTRVYIPAVGLTGVVEDREGFSAWNHFDVWSPVCYSTPTGWFKVAVLNG